MGLSIAIYDPYPEVMNEFLSLVRNFDNSIVVIDYPSSDQLLSDFQMQPNKMNLIIIGYHLNRLEMTTLCDHLLSFQPSTRIVRLTDAKDEHTSFYIQDDQALHYPYQLDEVVTLLQRLKYQLFIERRRRLVLHALDGDHQVFLRDVAVIEKVFRHVVIRQPEKPDIKIKNSMSEVINTLNGEPFIRCAPTVLVNMYHITQYGNTYFKVANRKVRITNEFRTECQTQYLRHIEKIRQR